jgi:hypothetical protein
VIGHRHSNRQYRFELPPEDFEEMQEFLDELDTD